ncbi:hypothetical protein MMC11_001009 [Xylographa trunciseda]|nr:hypothetical protein [Xylographa trunciseda]
MSAKIPWHAEYPPPRSPEPPSISRSELLNMLQTATPGNDFVLIDLRRTDHEGGTIRGSINLRAQTMYHSIPTLYSLFSKAKVQTVIWYCGSSRGRGTRAAAWFGDYCVDRGDGAMRSVILLEGIMGWATGGEEYVALMDGYDSGAWEDTQ